MKNNRTFLEKLFDGAEVEWKPLMELAEIGTGNSNRQDEEENGKYPFYVRSKNILRSNSFQFDETAIIIPGEGGIGEIFHYVEGKYALHQRAYRIHITSDEVNPKFLYYIMHNSFKNYILSKSVGATAISIRKPMLEKFEIPIPPLPVQTKIIKILDALTALTSELTSELTLRRKQYEYYREKLLSEEELGKVGFEWKTVKSLCNDNFWLMPATPEFDDNGNIPYITSKNIKGGKIDFQNTKYINEYVYQELSRTRCIIENDILISMIGTIGEAVIVKKEDLYFYGQNMYVLRLNNELVNHKFFLYYFTAPFILNSLLSKKNSSNQGYLKAGQIESLKIPIPPLPVQTRIVKILDKFETLTNSITEGLPLAIEQSQKRYEYYRELLLNFS